MAGLTLVALLVLLVPQVGDAGQERRLWPDQFAAARARESRPPAPTRPAPAAPMPAAQQFLGVSLWRVTPAPSGAASSEFAAQAIAAGQTLAEGTTVRISFESSRSGYLYVIDREEFADGSLGEPVLLFPTLRLRGGDNRVSAGRVVEVPDQRDTPPHFTLRRGRPDHVGERVTALVSDEPLPDVRVGEGPLVLDASQVAAWEKRAASAAERYDLPEARAYSSAEREAGGAQSRALVHTDPLPQSLFKLDAARLVAVQVSLRLVPAR